VNGFLSDVTVLDSNDRLDMGDVAALMNLMRTTNCQTWATSQIDRCLQLNGGAFIP